MNILILKGIPGSGKSTFAKQFVLDNPSYVRVCKDDLRRMRGKYWIPDQEVIIFDLELSACYTAARYGFDLLVDGTNLNQRTVDKILYFTCKGFINKCKQEGWEELKKFNLKQVWNKFFVKVFFNKDIPVLEFKYFDTSVEECIRRDSLREEPVGEKVIRDFHKKYQKERKYEV